MNAASVLNASPAVTPVADAVLAPGAADGATPLFAQVLGQEGLGEDAAPDTGEAVDTALAPWLMALGSQQAPALPFTQPFSRLLGAAAREGSAESAPPEAEATSALPAPGLPTAGLVAGSRAVPAPTTGAHTAAPLPASAPLADAASAGPALPAAPARSAPEAARAQPADATLLAAMAPRAARTDAPAPVNDFAAVLNANVHSGAAAANEPVVRLDPARSELWQRPLAQALGERVQWQSMQGIDQARIRLDPPALGRIEIVVRQEGAQLQVQLTASSPEVARQLQHMGEGLRQELGQRQGQGVQVQVHESGAQADARGQQRQGQPGRDDNEPGQALRSEHHAGQAFTLA